MRQSNVPICRFLEFKNEWQRFALNKFASKISDGIHSTPNYDDSGSYYFVNGNNLSDGEIIINNDTKRVAESEYEKHKRPLGNNTILISINGTIGNLAFYNNQKIVLGKSASYINLSSEINKYFLYFLLSTATVKKYIYSQLTGSTIKNLSIYSIKHLPLNLPSLKEQEKIASFLNAVDFKIEKLTRKKELLEEYKRGLMQKLFSREIRFKDENGKDYPDWGKVKLEDVATVSTGSSNKQDTVIDGKYKFFDRSVDILQSNKYLFDCEALIVPGEGSEFLPIYYYGKFDLHQRAYAIFNFKKILPKYLYYFMFFNKNYLIKYAVGSTVKSLRLPVFNNMIIISPSIGEQEKISTFLDKVDNKINLIEFQIGKTKDFKKGLLQQMFV